MENSNQTLPSWFFLLGLSTVPHLQVLGFFTFMIMYIITLLGNGLLLITVRISPTLHTPMYFFLSNLSFIDICFSSTIVPVILINTVSTDKSISVGGCVFQMFFSLVLGAAECILLSVMAYDRTHHLNHFLCEMPSFLRISCIDPWLNEVAMYVGAGIIVLCSFLLTLISYVYIISTILRIRSSRGRQAAFSTCASHLTVVTLYYGTIMSMYLRPPSSHSPEADRNVSVLYTVVTPMLNPIIYSIRNKEVKNCIMNIKEQQNCQKTF
ncbi:hypothetical protein GDO78_018980 [Eleutherodactylus coqui]|uniref:G-protein coupled receptors family 1 profile domain-containing protein n=1 Tax=Eleutherodactylus coqui TaxID=57060 RepID=A0A8J6C6V0_ELECQ|nr:hypothetical protein GDO78_018980 [Eleutherodactylus coqui]